MNVEESPEVASGWKRLAVWLAGASGLIYVFSRFLPCAPPAWHGEIEDSYMLALHTAFAGGWQFGRDFVFTFGPWGFLYGGYHPATHALAVVAWLGLGLAFWWAAWKAARDVWANALVAWLWLMAVAGVAGLPIFMMMDVGLKGFVILLWLFAFFLDDRPSSPSQAVLAVALGLLSLVKFSVFVDSAAVVALVGLDAIFRHRRFPWILPIFGGSVLVFWMAARQDLGALGPFLHYSWLLTRGFTESMMTTGPKETQDICLFAAMALGVWVVAGRSAWAGRRCLAAFPLAGLGLLLFTTFKYGYVRHDGHEVAATLELLLISLTLPAVARAMTRPITLRALALSLVPALLALGLAASTFSRYYPEGLPAHLLATLGPRQLVAPARLLRGEAALCAGYEKYLADIRAIHPVGPLPGTVDTYPGNAAAILAQGLPYRPRPVMQSYQAYAPELVELNASFLRSPRAPDSIYFQLLPIDDHFPALDDGLSWPELLARYNVREVSSSGVVLQRSRAPRPWHLVPLANLSARFGQVIALPAFTNAAVWAELDTALTPFGLAASTLYKPPILWLTVWTQEGQQFRYRLVPGLARSGFLLSPLVKDTVSFGVLAAAGGLQELGDDRVAAICLSVGTASGATACYESQARLQLFRLDCPAQDLATVNGFRELKGLWRALRRTVWLRADYPSELVSVPGIGSVLRVAPRSAMQLSLEGRPRLLRLGFGAMVRDAANPQSTNPVVFRVLALREGGERLELWSRQLEPSARNSGQARQQAVVDLSEAAPAELILETMPARPGQKGGPSCYWSQIDVE